MDDETAQSQQAFGRKMVTSLSTQNHHEQECRSAVDDGQVNDSVRRRNVASGKLYQRRGEFPHVKMSHLALLLISLLSIHLQHGSVLIAEASPTNPRLDQISAMEYPYDEPLTARDEAAADEPERERKFLTSEDVQEEIHRQDIDKLSETYVDSNVPRDEEGGYDEGSEVTDGDYVYRRYSNNGTDQDHYSNSSEFALNTQA